MDMCTPYDICVVGAGLIGSAAAKYASEDRNLKVALIGPEEPTERHASCDENNFGSYWDEARFTRSVELDPIWATLNQRSIAKYREIEEKSGVSFYGECGYLIADSRGGKWTREVRQAAERDGIHVDVLQGTQSHSLLGNLLHLDRHAECIHERTNAGILNPRKLVTAQLILALNQGCDVIRDVVTSIDRTTGSNGSSILRLVTRRGMTYHATKVLLATGISLFYRDLVARSTQIAFNHILYTAVKIEISKDDAKKLRFMPCIEYIRAGNTGNKLPCMRLLPPVKYPDDKYYIKISSGLFSPIDCDGKVSETEMRMWYNGEKKVDSGECLLDLFKKEVKGVKVLSWHPVNCAGVDTPTELPYIDMFDENKVVVFGDNGLAAKCSDQLGLIAAKLVVNGRWSHDLPADKFKLIKKGC